MRVYLLCWLCFVVFCHKATAAEAPRLPQMPEDAPLVYLPGDLSYSSKLLHAYNAQVDNPNLIVPRLEQILRDGRSGLQAWLPCVPDPGLFTDTQAYPVYRSADQLDQPLVLFLPPDRQTGISEVLRERLQRFIDYRCLADGFPPPRAGNSASAVYHATPARGDTSWLLLLAVGLLSFIAALLLALLLRRRWNRL